MYENEKMVSFSDPDEVKEFVRAASKCDFDIDLKYKRNLIDAKSILGVMNIGLKRSFKVCYAGSNADFENLIAKLSIA